MKEYRGGEDEGGEAEEAHEARGEQRKVNCPLAESQQPKFAAHTPKVNDRISARSRVRFYLTSTLRIF